MANEFAWLGNMYLRHGYWLYAEPLWKMASENDLFLFYFLLELSYLEQLFSLDFSPIFTVTLLSRQATWIKIR